MTATINWIDSPSWELDFFDLPHRIPWPADVEAAVAEREPFEVEHLLRAIEALGAEAPAEFRSFATASEKFTQLAEALEENEIGEATRLLDDIREIHPGTAFELFHRGYVARHEGDEAGAAILYGKASEIAPTVGAIWMNLGAVLGGIGRRDEAVAAFRKALTCKGENRPALEALAALKEVVKLKANDPNNPNAYAFVEMPMFHNMAAQQIQQLTDPEQMQAYGEQLLRDGLVPQVAIQALARAHELRPGNPRTMFTLSGAYHAVGEHGKAREMMEQFTQAQPQDPQGFFRLAQACNALNDEPAEMAALDRAIELDPNLQPAIGIRFKLAPGEHDPAKEDALSKFAAEKGSWMAYVMAGTIARERGDNASSLRLAERAMELNPNAEEPLLHYSSALGEAREISKLASVIKPAVESGKFSKRLDWNYAQVLQQLGLTKDAVAVLRKSSENAQDDFRKMAETMIDAWTGMVSGCGVRLEISPAGLLQRPILITLADGDGGVVIDIGSKLPAEGQFPWRAQGSETFVALQQGHSGVREPRPLGVFRVRGITESPTGPTTISCQVVAQPDGTVLFRAGQANRKLPVAWAPAKP